MARYRQAEHQLDGFGGVLQVRGAARQDHAGGQQVLVQLRRVVGEDLVELPQHVLADEIQRLLVAQRADLGDGPAVELLVAEAAVARGLPALSATPEFGPWPYRRWNEDGETTPSVEELNDWAAETMRRIFEEVVAGGK